MSFFKRIVVPLALVVCCASNISMASIYFNAKIYGPVTNVYSIDAYKRVKKITQNTRWKDIDHDVSTAKDVVFSSNRAEQRQLDLDKSIDVFDLYFFSEKTQEITRLTNSKEREFSPKFSPKTEHIAYLKLTDSKFTELRVVTSNGENDQLLAIEKDIFDFSWSPDSKRIAYSLRSANKVAIDIVNLESGKISTVLEFEILEKKTVFLTAPTWAPNGKQLAYVTHPSYKSGEKALFILNLETMKTERLSAEGLQIQAPIHWSKNSARILYSALVDYSFYYDPELRDKVHKGSMQIFISEPSGKSLQLTKGEHFHGKPVFSPDESKVAYLFSEQLGGALSFSLRILSVETGKTEEVFKRVQRESKLVWR